MDVYIHYKAFRTNHPINPLRPLTPGVHQKVIHT